MASDVIMKPLWGREVVKVPIGLVWQPETRHIIVSDGDGQPVLMMPLSHLAVAAPGRVTVRRRIAWDFIRERPSPRLGAIPPQRFNNSETLRLPTDDPHTDILITSLFHTPWHQELTISSTNPLIERIYLSFQTSARETWWGFGEHGHTIRPVARFDTWVEEGPVGLGWLSRFLRFTNHVPFPKGPYPSYATMPIWISSAGYSAWADNRELMRWRIASTLRSVEAWSHKLTLHIITGDNPQTILERQFSILGKPTIPPPWAFGPWNDSVRGQPQAKSLVRLLRQRRIPSSALWIEDWMGSWENGKRFWMRPLSHQVDAVLYPDFPGLAMHLHETGFRLLGYFCPEITENSALYHEAAAQDLLVKDSDGYPIMVDILGILHAEVDLTHPKTERWIHERWFRPAEALGFDGWMADFGEYLPPQSVLSDGTTGWARHNQWPLLWQTVHKNFWSQARPDGDFTFFVRSSSLGSHAIAPILWGGDSDTDFDPSDGLPTVVPQVLSAQLAGFFFWATDIAGYMTFGLTRPSTKPLYIRWLQLASLLPVMRTHHGTARPRNWHLSRDEETLNEYARFARLHTALFPLWNHLAQQAANLGHPIIRPLFFEFPNDRSTWTIDQQFLVGDVLLVAPVVKPRSHRHRVYLPMGQWRYWWSNRIDIGPGWITLSVPLHEIPIWIRVGRVLPLFEGIPLDDVRSEGIVDSLADIEQGAGVDLKSASRHLAIYVVGKPGPTHIWLPHGGSWTVEWRPEEANSPRASLWQMPYYADHLPQDFGEGERLMLDSGQSASLSCPGHGRLTLSASSDSGLRSCTVRWTLPNFYDQEVDHS